MIMGIKVPLGPLGLRKQDVEAINKVLASGNLTMGKEVIEFENEMAQYLGTKYFVMVNSGSSANLAIFESLLRPSLGEPGLKRGDIVLVPSIAWPTSIWPIIQLGLVPSFVDVEEHTLAIDLLKAQEVVDRDINNSVRAIFPIHPLGYGINSIELDEFAQRNNLILVNDVCEALGSWQEKGHSGTSGAMSSFSFYFSHHMTTMEGGGVATNNPSLLNDLRSIRSHGWSRDRNDIEAWDNNMPPSMRKFTFMSTGFNIRPMEIQAAVGREQLRDLSDFLSKRRRNVEKIYSALPDKYFEIIGTFSGIDIKTFQRHSWMHIPIRIKHKNPKKSRLRVVKFLEDSGVETRPPLTGNFLRQPAMRKFRNLIECEDNYRIADEITDSTFLVGCHHDLSDTQIDYLSDKLIESVKYLSQ
jgi:CDP-6-deoxy-D-xylo-4-hexulose-3-dehydrase